MLDSGARRAPDRQPILISFSGLDGAGKSTQIEHLRSYLAAAGYRTTLLAFWDNVVVLSRYREGFVHKVYKSEIGVGAPDKPVQRRDKNVRKWYLTLTRHLLYFLDAVNLAMVLRATRCENPDVIIMDRYIYDEWANLPLRSRFTHAYIQLLHALLPRPDIAYLLDADPDTAHARKPEYPVHFMHRCRAAYYRLAGLLGTMIIIPSLGLEQAKQATEAVLRRMVHERELQPQVANASPSSVRATCARALPRT